MSGGCPPRVGNFSDRRHTVTAALSPTLTAASESDPPPHPEAKTINPATQTPHLLIIPSIMVVLSHEATWPEPLMEGTARFAAAAEGQRSEGR